MFSLRLGAESFCFKTVRSYASKLRGLDQPLPGNTDSAWRTVSLTPLNRCAANSTNTQRTKRILASGKRNYYDCLNGRYGCNAGQLTTSEQATVATPKQNGSAAGVINSAGQNTSTPVSPACAENGSCYGDPNQNGVPKTVHVNGYYRKDGTYVRGYYRSAPGTNPPRSRK